MATNMEQIKKQRACVKSAFTRMLNHCNSGEANEDSIKVRCERANELFETFEKIQEMIESEAMSDTQLAEEEQYRNQIESAYFAIKESYHRIKESDNNVTIVEPAGVQQQQFTNILETLTKNQSDLGSLLEKFSEGTITPIPQVPNMSTTQQNSVQLQRINLPEFDGAYLNWIRFRDLFCALIHNQHNLTNIEKFEYLQTHVKGDAMYVIKHLNLSNENYPIAWELWKKKFENSQLIKKNYLRLLFDQPAMKGALIPDLKRLINNCNECVNALKAMNENIETWDIILLFHLERKLDSESQILWSRTAADSPKYSEFMLFLEKRLRELENICNNKTPLQQISKQRTQSHIHIATIKNCPVCKQAHFVFNCEKFKALSTVDRIDLVRKNNIFYNCLQYDHLVTRCTRSCCRICKKKHNTLLHRDQTVNIEKKETEGKKEIESNELAEESDKYSCNTVSANNIRTITLLPTAVVQVLGGDNEYHICRILLDTGAQASLITESCVQRLRLQKSYDRSLLCGIGTNNSNYARGKLHVTIKSRYSDECLITEALCLSTLTHIQPAMPITSNEFAYFNNLQLADPKCNTPCHIDMILGANVFNQWFLNQQITHPSGSPSALKTIFGWVIIGNVTAKQEGHFTVAHSSVDLSEQLQKFWDVEELNDKKRYLTDEEHQAEDHYQKTVTRDASGRYVVRLPFKKPLREFGNTKTQAEKRLRSMESKFSHNATLFENYVTFMKEYVELNHMEILQDSTCAHYYMPHHAVHKNDSTTTKLRVVFDGSARGSNGTSLNEQLLIGPTIQNDIFTILLNFRKYKVGMSADVEKMYRQILVHKDDRPYQCILWRTNKDNEVSTYQLKTVTYGTSAAPFLAVRTLKQVAIDQECENPLIAKYIHECFYVDDFMSSVPNINEAIDLRVKLCDILSNAGLHLRKWCSNSDDILSTIDKDDREINSKIVIDETKTVKTLGLFWDTAVDSFSYSVSVPNIESGATKRSILSIISRVYDPLGWVSPIVVTLKLFMQTLWVKGFEWDSPLPENLQQQWVNIHNNISYIQKLQIPRWLRYCNEFQAELHGFADSSEKVYAAVIYLKVIHNDGTITAQLVASKTRVAQ